jgi:hypothetical protein
MLIKFRKFLIMIGLVFLLSATAMCEDAGKYFFMGAGIDPESTPQAMGMGGIAVPMSPTTLWYTDYDISVLPGATLKTILDTSALQFSIRTGAAQRVYQVDRYSLWGLFTAGIGAGPQGENTLGTSVRSSFAYGGFVDISLKKGFGLLAILQCEKNASVNGFRFIPRLAIRYKFQ